MRCLIGFAAAVLIGATPADAESAPTLVDRQLKAAEALIDAFYSFDPTRLRAAMPVGQG